MMRALFVAILLLLSSGARAANSKQSINIQGVLRDATGSLQSMAVGLDVHLYTSETAASAFYTQHFLPSPSTTASSRSSSRIRR
jgi:hypothetical protein